VPLAHAAQTLLPARMIETIDRAMSFHAEQRPQNIAEFEAGLDWRDNVSVQTLARSASAERTTGRRSVSPTPPVAGRAVPAGARAKLARRSRLVAVAAGIAVFAVTGILVANPFGWFRPKLADQCGSREAMESVATRGEAGLEEFLAACPTGPLAIEARQRL